MILTHPATNRKSAFTLIEVLLAVSVFAIVLGAINSVFFAALRLRNKTTKAIEEALPLQQTLALMQKDFEGIMLPGGRFGGSFATTITSSNTASTFIGERVTPDLYTTSGPVTDSARWSDVQKVAYFLAPPTNNLTISGGKDVVRQVTRNMLPVNIEDVERQRLMGGVQTIQLQYYNGLSWVDTWDSSTSTNLPVGIKIQITLTEDYMGTTRTPDPIELVLPVSVQMSTNSTSQSDGGGQ